MERETIGRLLNIVRVGGYFVAGGALVGFSVGVYLLFNRAIFSFVIRISQYEVMNYFLGVFMPSFAILIIIGYLFATTFGLKSADLSSVAPLCVLSLLCIVLSALSIFYFVSFIGGVLTLTWLIRAYTRPMFETLSRREAFFLVEVGAIFVASYSALFLLMWFVSNYFQTYVFGFYGSYSPYALLWVLVMSILMFFAIPLFGSRGTNAGWSGAFSLVMSVLSFLTIVQTRYVFLNAPAYIGVFMLVLGFILTLAGDLIYLRLFVTELRKPNAIQPFLRLYYGKYCPYCGKPRLTVYETWCSHCGRSLMWTPDAPFCSSCGRLVPANAQTCPHCQEDLRSKRIYFHQKEAEEQAIANKLTTKLEKKKRE